MIYVPGGIVVYTAFEMTSLRRPLAPPPRVLGIDAAFALIVLLWSVASYM
jgi:hypothetical protein